MPLPAVPEAHNNHLPGRRCKTTLVLCWRPAAGGTGNFPFSDPCAMPMLSELGEMCLFIE
jgi:hypothetical protein